jgi:hypothetical protein
MQQHLDWSVQLLSYGVGRLVVFPEHISAAAHLFVGQEWLFQLGHGMAESVSQLLLEGLVSNMTCMMQLLVSRKCLFETVSLATPENAKRICGNQEFHDKV